MEHRNEYTQDIKLNFLSNLESIKQKLDSLQTDFDLSFTEDSSIVKKKSGFDTAINTSIEGFQQGVSELLESSEVMSKAVDIFKNVAKFDFALGVSSLIVGFGKLISNAFKEINNMRDYLYMTNSDIREMKLTYGLTDSEAYAMSKMDEIMEFNSLEDKLWMTNKQQDTYIKGIEKLTRVFEDTMYDNKDLADAMTEFQVDLEVLKIQLLIPFMTLITDNKDLLIDLMNSVIDFIPIVTDFIHDKISSKEAKEKRKEFWSSAWDRTKIGLTSVNNSGYASPVEVAFYSQLVGLNQGQGVNNSSNSETTYNINMNNYYDASDTSNYTNRVDSAIQLNGY